MIHKMKLNESPFERIKNGTKTRSEEHTSELQSQR